MGFLGNILPASLLNLTSGTDFRYLLSVRLKSDLVLLFVPAFFFSSESPVDDCSIHYVALSYYFHTLNLTNFH